LGYEEAIEKVTDALRSEGFGILTKIDVKDTIKRNWILIFVLTEFLVPATRPLHTKRLKQK
jgi:uncharacterized protein (DUF302 family)